MDDCDKFELFYVNPLKKPMKILVQGFDEKWKEATRRECVIPSRGLQIFDFNNQSRSIVFVENRSRASLLRPTIFKYYDSFFDVLHG